MIPEQDNTGRTCFKKRTVSSDGKIEVGIFPVMFGYRLRAGYVGDQFCQLDWCFGENLVLLQLIKHQLEKHIDENPSNPFKGLPSCSEVKPIYNDEKFMETITEILKTKE